jgi:hypothetical protein
MLRVLNSLEFSVLDVDQFRVLYFTPLAGRCEGVDGEMSRGGEK